jgi:hypothetical protein
MLANWRCRAWELPISSNLSSGTTRGRAGCDVSCRPAASKSLVRLFLYFPRYASETPKLRAFIETLRKTIRVPRSN